MPYYIYRVTESDQIGLVKNLEPIECFDGFRDAKLRVRDLRAERADDDAGYLKIVFASSELEAEELLQAKREKPVLMEHEK